LNKSEAKKFSAIDQLASPDNNIGNVMASEQGTTATKGSSTNANESGKTV